MDKHLPALIHALLNPGRYPDPAKDVGLIETHISWVLLAGDFAYKIKKPVTLPFLDFGTLEKRKACCQAELRLNHRFAPNLYLDVVPIVGAPENPRFGGDGEPIEFAVKMRRFAEAGRLDRMSDRGELTSGHISELAGMIVAFHQSASIAPLEARFGAPGEILAPVLQNFEGLRKLLRDREEQARLDALLAWSRTEFERLKPKFIARKEAGWVRECHGDLHLGNIALIDGRVTLFDCIEFNEAFRWIDVASEVAFVYVDLLDHRQPGLACWFLNEWLSLSGDHDAVPVLRFYAVYRAMVRAKVAAIRAEQTGGDQRACQDYIALAYRLISPPRPRLIITHGLSGCGKTVASTRLLLRDPDAATLRLRSDVERKRLYGLTPQASSHSPVDAGIYGKEAHDLTYRHLQELARRQLEAGWSTLVDAAFLKRGERAAFQNMAHQAGAEFYILAPEARPEQLRERIISRLKKGSDASEANLDVLEKQMRVIEVLDGDERKVLLPAQD